MGKAVIRKKIAYATLFLACASVGSNILGLLRDRIFVWRFGAGDALDAYYAAFRIPDLIFTLLVLGALFSAFIPVFTEYISKGEKKTAFFIANSIINLSVIVLLLAGIFIFIFAPQLMSIIAPGFKTNLDKIQTTINLTRLMLICPILFGISNIIGGILNSFKRFYAYALAPVVYNLGIISGALFLVPLYGIYGLAYGVILGAFLHMIIQIPAVFQTGYRFRPNWNVTHKAVKQIGKLMLPQSLSLGVGQIKLIVDTMIASILRSGSVAIINLANNIQTVPTVIFGISYATTIFPNLAEKASLGKEKEFVDDFSWAFRQICFLIIPSSLGLILLRAQVVRLVLGAAKFTWEDTRLAAAALGFFAISLIAQATVPLLARCFYAMQDTKTPLIFTITSVAVNIAAAFLLASYFGFQHGVKGLALAFTIASFVNMFLLFWVLHSRLGNLDDLRIINCLIKITIASIIMSFAVQGAKYAIAPQVNMQTGVGVGLQTLGSIAVGVAVYFTAALVLKCQEISGVKKVFKRFKLNNR
jgi:putative peptidoglycan lipid II flippase